MQEGKSSILFSLLKICQRREMDFAICFQLSSLFFTSAKVAQRMSNHVNFKPQMES